MSKKHQNKSTFNGFKQSSTTPVPDDLFDELLSILTGSELKVLLYIIRRTKGFNKDADAISLSQFQKGIVTKKEGKQLDKGCGISDRQTIIDALVSLENKKCIGSEKSKTASGDNAVSIYHVLFNTEVVGKTNQGKEKPTTLVGNSNRGGRKNPKKVVGNSNPQETVIQQTDSQETVIQETITGNETANSNIVPNGTSPSVSAQDQIAEMKAKIEQLEALMLSQQASGVPNANSSPYTTSAGPSNTNVDSSRSDNSNTSADDSTSSHGMEDSKNVEHSSSHIVNPTIEEEETQQETLFDVPAGPPVMPHEGAKWCPETLVQVTEAKLGHRFEEIMRGKTQKTQRERQLIAAKKIIAAKVTREEFDKAYDDKNDDWWRGKYGELTVVDMAGNTKNNVMRTLEVLENIARRKGLSKDASNVISFQNRQKPSGSTQPATSARVSAEVNQRNREKQRQRSEAAIAAGNA